MQHGKLVSTGAGCVNGISIFGQTFLAFVRSQEENIFKICYWILMMTIFLTHYDNVTGCLTRTPRIRVVVSVAVILPGDSFSSENRQLNNLKITHLRLQIFIIIITRPWPAFGRQGLVGLSGGCTFHGYTSHASPRACGARLGRKVSRNGRNVISPIYRHF